MNERPGRLHVGTSGWTLDWEDFYPRGLPSRSRLSFYAERFRTVEVNYTFYHLPRGMTCENWAEQTPEGFVFSVKLSRYITHVKRLHGVKTALREFAERTLPLGPKLGPILVQLPPSFALDIRRLERFLHASREIGEEHGPRRLRLAFEFRHPTWFTGDAGAALEALERHASALVCGHSSRYPYPDTEPVTADFMYLRFHGPEKLFASAYGRRGLARWAPRIQQWLDRGIDVFAYFNNDVGGHAVRDAQVLLSLLEH